MQPAVSPAIVGVGRLHLLLRRNPGARRASYFSAMIVFRGVERLTSASTSQGKADRREEQAQFCSFVLPGRARFACGDSIGLPSLGRSHRACSKDRSKRHKDSPFMLSWSFPFSLSAPPQSHSLGRVPPLERHFSFNSTASQARAYAHQVSAVRGDMPRTSAHWASVKPPK